MSGYSRPCNVLKANERPGSVPGAWHRSGRLFASIRSGDAPGAWHRFGCLFASIDLASHLVPGTDLAACLLASDLAPRLVPGTDLVAPIWLPFSSIDRLGSQTQATVDLLRSWCLAPI